MICPTCNKIVTLPRDGYIRYTDEEYFKCPECSASHKRGAFVSQEEEPELEPLVVIALQVIARRGKDSWTYVRHDDKFLAVPGARPKSLPEVL